MKCQKESVNPHLSNDDSQIENMDYNDELPSDKIHIIQLVTLTIQFVLMRP